MKRRPNKRISRLSSEISPLLKQAASRRKGIHPEIWSRWQEIVGPDLARRAIPDGFYHKTLVITVVSSSWLQELTYLKKRLLERFREEVGPDVVEDIKLKLAANPQNQASRTPSINSFAPQTTLKKKPPLDADIASAIAQVDDPELKSIIEQAARANFTAPHPPLFPLVTKDESTES